MSDSPNKLPKMWFILPAIAAAIIWGFWALLQQALSKLGIETSYATLGPWGDSFGALNALFGSLACIAVVATFWMQRRELNNQQEQITEQRQEQRKHQFESSFFQLLGLLRDLRKEVKIAHSGQSPSTGADAIKKFHDLFLQEIKAQRFYETDMSRDEVAGKFENATRMEKENELGPYFRVIYTILRRTYEDQALSPADKEKYGNLVRSQLSTAEIGLVGLNGLTKQSNDFEKFIVEFRLLKYLPEGYLRNLLGKFYPKATFEARD